MDVNLEQAALDQVDEAELRRLVTEHLHPVERLDVSLLAGGASNLTYLITTDDERYVARRRPLGPSAPKAHDMEREFRTLHALAGTGFPAPTVYFYEAGTRALGAPFYVMQHRAGLIIHGPGDAAGLTAGQASRCTDDLMRTLTRLHSIPLRNLPLRRSGRPGGFLERRITSWLRQWGSVEHRDFPEVHELGEVLLTRLPAQDAETLMHGDYRLGNVVLDVASSSPVTAVLDWEMSTIGDPLTDLAHLLVYWEPTCGRLTHPSQLVSRHDGFPSAGTLAQRYADETGREVDGLAVYVAFEHWRAAIIKDAIFLRRSATHGIDEEAESFGASVGQHLAEAADVLMGKGLAILGRPS
jgi:aminoglycoside phosphotransferase (APT) family kinase protein